MAQVPMTTVHMRNGFFAPTGVEYPLTLMFVCIALIVTGPGNYALDARLT